MARATFADDTPTPPPASYNSKRRNTRTMLGSHGHVVVTEDPLESSTNLNSHDPTASPTRQRAQPQTFHEMSEESLAELGTRKRWISLKILPVFLIQMGANVLFAHPLGYPAFFFAPLVVGSVLIYMGLIYCILVCGVWAPQQVLEKKGMKYYVVMRIMHVLLVGSMITRGILPMVYTTAYPPFVTYLVVVVTGNFLSTTSRVFFGCLRDMSTLEKALWILDLLFKYLDTISDLFVGILMLKTYESTTHLVIGIIITSLACIDMPILLQKCSCIGLPKWTSPVAFASELIITALTLYSTQGRSQDLDVPMLAISITFSIISICTTILLFFRVRHNARILKEEALKEASRQGMEAMSPTAYGNNKGDGITEHSTNKQDTENVMNEPYDDGAGI